MNEPFMIDQETYVPLPQFKLVRHGEKYRIYNSETKRFYATSLEGTHPEWFRDIPEWLSKSHITEWHYNMAKLKLVDILGI